MNRVPTLQRSVVPLLRLGMFLNFLGAATGDRVRGEREPGGLLAIRAERLIAETEAERILELAG